MNLTSKQRALTLCIALLGSSLALGATAMSLSVRPVATRLLWPSTTRNWNVTRGNLLESTAEMKNTRPPWAATG